MGCEQMAACKKGTYGNKNICTRLQTLAASSLLTIATKQLEKKLQNVHKHSVDE